MITLFALPISVHSAKVRLALRIKGIPFKELSPPNGYGSGEYRSLIPSGTIPAIATDEGNLFESEAIIEYVEERWPDPPLLPKAYYLRAFARSGSRYHDTRIEPIVRSLFPFVGNQGSHIEKYKEAAKLLKDRLLRLLESHLPGPYLAGNELTLADLAYPSTLMMAETILAHGGAKLEIPLKLEEWQKLLMADARIFRQVEDVHIVLDAWIKKKVFDAHNNKII
jgi:glutathione S-transferase